jgi:hypothetical protein
MASSKSVDDFRNRPQRLIGRPDLDTRTAGKAVIVKAISSADISISSSGKDIGTGDVTFTLTETGVVAGNYNNFTVDSKGRIIKAWTTTSSSGTGGGGTGGGVSRVGLSLPASLFDVTVGLVVTTGTLTAELISQSPNYVFAAPDGESGIPIFRALRAADLPTTSVAPGSYGSGSSISTFTVDQHGRITAASSVALVFSTSEIPDLDEWPGSTSLITLGTVTTGVWRGSPISYSYGGTGLTSPGVLAGNLRWNGTAYVIDTATYVAEPSPTFYGTATATALVISGFTTAGVVQTSATGALSVLTAPDTDGYVLASTIAGTLYWTTPGSAVGTLAHDQLTGLNDDPLVQHVTTAEITKWNGYDAQIQALAARSGISTSILLVNDSSLNGTVVDYHSISSVTFLISGASPTDTVVLNDASKISSVPSNIIGSRSVTQVAGAWYLTVNLVNLTYGQTDSITVNSGCVLVNNSLINSNSIQCAWTTLTSPQQPVVGASAFNGRFGLDPASVTEIRFPVTVSSGTLNLVLASPSAWSCVPQNIVTADPTIDTASNSIVFALSNAQLDTQYQLSVNPGMVSNSGYILNSAGASASFGTTLSVPVVGASPDDGNTSVDVTASGRFVRFPLSTPTGRGKFDIADTSKITITGGTFVSASIVSNVLQVYYTGGSDGSSVTFLIGIGAIKNYNTLGDMKLNETSRLAAIQYAVRAPTLSAPSISGNQDVDVSVTTILVPYTSTATVTLDSSLIISTNSGEIVSSSLTTVGSQSYISIITTAGVQDQASTITLGVGVIKNLNVTPNAAALSFSFRRAASVPVISQSTVNGTSVNASTTTLIKFAVTGTDTLAIADLSKITVSAGGLSGTPTISGGFLNVPVSLVANVNYSIIIGIGAIRNRNTVNPTSLTCNFATATTFSVSQSPVNSTRISSTTTSISFSLSNINGTASLADATKISGVNCVVGTAVVSGSTLTVPISGLTVSSSVSVTVSAGAVTDSVMANTNTVTCSFTTLGSVPTLSNSTLDSQTKVAVSTTVVDFPITASGTVTLVSSSLVTSTPSGAISSVQVLGSLGNYKLRVNLNTIATGTNYTIVAAAGVISNDGTTNTASVSCGFKTIDAAPVLTQTSLNGTYQDASSLSTIMYAITSSSACTLADASKITISGGPTIVSSTVTSTNLIVTVTGAVVNETVTLTVAAGAIANADAVTNTGSMTTTIYTKGDVPDITQSTANGQNSITLTPAYIEYAVTASGTVAVANANMVTVSPNHLQSVSMVSGKLRLQINFQSNVNYTVTISAGLLVNAQTLSTASLTTTFKTVFAAPVVGQSTTNGTTQPTTLTSIDFPITSSGTLAIVSSTPVTATNATVASVTLVGTALRVALTGLTNSKSVSVTVGAGTVTNGDTQNTGSITCTFTTAGSVPVLVQSTVSGTVISRTTTSIQFNVTSVSGTLTLANSAKAYAPSGYDAIVSSVSIVSGKVQVNLSSAMVFNKAYRIQLDPGLVANDGVANTNAITCDFTTTPDVPVVGQSPVNGTVQAPSLTSVTFPVTAGAVTGTLAVADSSKITGTNCTIVSSAISSGTLTVQISGLNNSRTATVTVAAGAVSNSGVTSTAGVTATFTTVGSVVTILQSSSNGSTAIATGAQNIDFQLSASSFGTLSVNAAKITSTPSAIASTPTIVTVSGINYLRVPMTLAALTSYTISIAAGAVVNDSTASTSAVSCTFTTVSGGSTRPILYTFQFTLPNAASNINLVTQTGWGSNTLTTEDIYGPAYDGVGSMAELRWYGYQGNITQPDGYVVPRNGIDTYTTTTNPDHGYTYDGAGTIQFDSGSSSPKIYKIIKYSA